jgi:hypothetical protein
VLVHDVDHAVAETPQQKERAHQQKCEQKVLPVGCDEHAFLAVGLIIRHGIVPRY